MLFFVLNTSPVSSSCLFVFVVTECVIFSVPDGIRKILLLDPVVRVIVRVLVVLTLDGSILTVIVLVLKLARNWTASPSLYIRHRCIDPLVSRI